MASYLNGEVYGDDFLGANIFTKALKKVKAAGRAIDVTNRKSMLGKTVVGKFINASPIVQINKAVLQPKRFLAKTKQNLARFDITSKKSAVRQALRDVDVTNKKSRFGKTVVGKMINADPMVQAVKFVANPKKQLAAARRTIARFDPTDKNAKYRNITRAAMVAGGVFTGGVLAAPLAVGGVVALKKIGEAKSRKNLRKAAIKAQEADAQQSAIQSTIGSVVSSQPIPTIDVPGAAQSRGGYTEPGYIPPTQTEGGYTDNSFDNPLPASAQPEVDSPTQEEIKAEIQAAPEPKKSLPIIPLAIAAGAAYLYFKNA